MALKYYDTARILSYNAVFNFLVGDRGLGKTYGFKVKAIKDNIKNGAQFIYLRRYKPETIASKQTFFADILNEFPDWDFRTVGNLAQRAPISTRDEKKREWITMGYFLSLSTAQSLKSVSYPLVRTIIFDEFILEKMLTNYLPNEADVMLNFYVTVNRTRDGKDMARVYFLANAVSIMNPYFIKWKIRPDQFPEIGTMHKGFILWHFPNSEEYRSGVAETTLGRFIQGSEYEAYAFGSEFKDANDSLIELKTSKARYHFTLETKAGKFAVWYDLGQRTYYAQARRPKSELIVTLDASMMSEDKILMSFSDKPLGYLRTAFRQGKVFFDSPETRNQFAEIFKR